VSGARAPILETRRADEFVAALRERIPAYVPGWRPRDGGPADALLRVYAQYLDAIAERVDRAPDKNQLAFLDLLGLELLPAQAARAPVVFQTLPQLGDGHASAGTRLGAKSSDGGDPIVFETESDVALAAARVAEVVTVWPGRDGYADHSAAAIGGEPFTLWEPLQPIRHELYLAHELYFALAGQASVELAVELAGAGSSPLRVAWQYWDGQLWRNFLDPQPGDDATAGLTRTGTVRLRTECAQSAPTTVGGFTSFWLRGALAEPLPPDPSRSLPQVDRITMRTVLERKVGSTGTDGLLPDTAFAGAAKLDATKPFQPFGPAPSTETSFYVACAEAFSRPGADVTIALDRPYTPQEENDIALAKYEVGVNEAKARIDQLRQAAAALDAALKLVVDPTTGELRGDQTPLFDNTTLEDWYAMVRANVQTALDAVRGVAQSAQASQAADATAAGTVLIWDLMPPEPLSKGATAWGVVDFLKIPLAIIAISDAAVIVGLATAANALASPTADPTLTTRLTGHLVKLQGDLTAIQNDVNALRNGDVAAALRILGAGPTLLGDWFTVATELSSWPPSIFLDPALPQIFITARQRYADMRARIDGARTKINGVLGDGATLEGLLAKLTPEIAAAAANVVKPTLDEPTLQWDYWDGSAWKMLRGLNSTDVAGNPSVGPQHFRHGRGFVGFTAPADWDVTQVNNVDARWLRVRIRTGAFAIVKTVTWFDQESESINYLPIIEPRPPLLDIFTIGYHWVSDPASPERCLTFNDFQWADRTEEAAWHGNAFEPYSPAEDSTPALYVGFDKPLPADLVGLFLDVVEVAGETSGPPLDWQCWDGSGWSRVTVEDETAGLALPGIVHVLWPGVDAPPAVPFAAAADATVRLSDARTAAIFAPGDQLWISSGEKGELATVDAVAGDTVTLHAPLTRNYARGTVGRAGLPRFGVPRTWLRARLRNDGDPRRARVAGVHANAVWASQIQTVHDELLGSATGQPRQTLFFTRVPVLHGETVEVRELDGPRAAVEYSLLVEELGRTGIRESDLRTVTDRRTGKIVEIWVPWTGRPNLLFSGPGDRHYTLERSHGRLIFGDGVNGRVPPAGANAIRARRYRSGGGREGNVPVGAIAQTLSGVVVRGVANPLPAEGGARGEADEAVLRRGPLTLRNWRQAISTDDYEALAREASPAVALARALSATRPNGRHAAGWVTVVVAPWSPDAEPQPAFELRREVREFLLARTPAALAGRLAVVGPRYQRVGVDAVVAPEDAAAAGRVAEAARRAIAAFLHPLTGGPAGEGWATHREVCLSSVATLLERLDGVDYVESLLLLDRGTVAGDVLPVTSDRLVSAGPVHVRLVGGER
jgi:hypothetical protein